MPKFRYIASDPRGATIRGTLDAASKTELTRQLQARGLFLVSFRDDDASAIPSPATPLQIGAPSANGTVSESSSPSTQDTFWKRFIRQKTYDPAVGPRGKVTLKELVVFTRQISISINAGMSFVEALQGLATNTRNSRMA